MSEELLPLSIDSLAFGGAGVGRSDGKVVFVPNTFPGDVALVKISKWKKNFGEGDLATLQTPSPLRRTPVCTYVNDCGGCPWMPLEYAAQLDWKRKIVSGQLAHIGGINVEVSPTAPSPMEYGYRTRVRLKTSVHYGAFKIGYCKPKSHDIVEIEKCAVACEPINKMIPEVRRYMAGAPEISAIVNTVKFETGYPPGKGRVTIDAEGAVPPAWLSGLLEACPSVAGAVALNGRDLTARGETELETDCSDGMVLKTGPALFSQVNPSANLALIEKINRLASLAPGMRVLDLFCGTGNLTFPLAKSGAFLTGVEFAESSVDAARLNGGRLGMGNAEFIRGDAGKMARTMARDGRRFDVVILDPPRGGATGLAKTLALFAPKKVVYVSCYPPTLARDAAEMAKEGFRLESVEPLDMFPHTAHVESVSLFMK
jgi:23S rRNA (uracil1939-C5)-methyltransferase